MRVLRIVCSELQTCVQSFCVLKYLPSDHVCLDVWPLICCANKFHEQDQNSMFHFTDWFTLKEGLSWRKRTESNTKSEKPSNGSTADVIQLYIPWWVSLFVEGLHLIALLIYMVMSCVQWQRGILIHGLINLLGGPRAKEWTVGLWLTPRSGHLQALIKYCIHTTDRT